MKMKYFKKTIFTFAFVFITSFSFAQMMGPNDPGGNPETGGDPPIGGDAPLSGGIIVLFITGAAYGSKKAYDLWQKIPA